MTFLAELCSNKPLITAVLGWFIAQALKVVFVRIKDKKIDISRMIGSGGMPSSHSSFVVALTTAVGYECSMASVEFAICVVVAFVTMYDASGVRRETGQQAEIINRIMESLDDEDFDMAGKKLKELIGHSPLEVLAGAVLGIIIAVLMYGA